jgi:hypothetical protein
MFAKVTYVLHWTLRDEETHARVIKAWIRAFLQAVESLFDNNA